MFGYGPGNLHLADGRYVGPVNLLQYQYPGETLGVPPISGCGDFSCFGSPPGWFPTGYDPASHAIRTTINPFASEQTIIPKTERYTIYADGSYEITDGIELYGEFLENRRNTYQNGWRQIWAFGYGNRADYSTATYWAPGLDGLELAEPDRDHQPRRFKPDGRLLARCRRPARRPRRLPEGLVVRRLRPVQPQQGHL